MMSKYDKIFSRGGAEGAEYIGFRPLCFSLCFRASA